MMIGTRVNNVEVKGAITGRIGDYLEVEILQPFEHVAMHARVPRSRDGLEDLCGDEWAAILLAHIYEICAYTWRNIHWLSREYVKLKREMAALRREDIEASEFGYSTYFMKMHFFHANYPGMNVQEHSWEGLLILIEDLMDRPERYAVG